MDRQVNATLQLLDAHLSATYRNAAQQTIQRNRRALQRIVAGFDESQYAGYTQEQITSQREFYANEMFGRKDQPGGRYYDVLLAIIAAIALCGRNATQTIQGQMFNVYWHSYNSAMWGINSQFSHGVNIPLATKAQLRALQSQMPGSPFTQIAFQNLGLASQAHRLEMINLLQGKMRDIIIAGGGVDDLTQVVRNAFNQQHMGLNRARLIAKQESRRLANEGRQTGWELTNQLGIVADKVWIHTGMSEEPRDDHLAMNGKVSDEDGYFTLPNGERAQYPTAPNLSANQSIGCTCGFVTRVRNPRAVTQSYIDNARRVLAADIAGGVAR